MVRAPWIAGVAEDVVVADRSIGEFGQVQRRDLVTAGSLEAGQYGRILSGRLVRMYVAPPAGNLALPVEHVFVGQRDAMQRAEVASVFQGLVGGGCGVKGFVLVDRDDGVALLVGGFQPDEGGFGRLA